ncbi:response regulator [Schaalia vaccimaxillae]|uniref:response regulator n=1 Tax=Schaalia vaccimaxillae TaxID=183916 RepID=UPI000A06C594
MLLGAQPDMDVVWQADNGQEALDKVHQRPVDVILLDVQMPVLDGIETTQRLVELGVSARIVILTTFDTDGYVIGAIEAGASGFLLKNSEPAALVDAIRTVAGGDSVISPSPTKRLFTALRQPSQSVVWDGRAPLEPRSAPAFKTRSDQQLLADLTDREVEILQLIALGLTNQELCDRLWVSMTTIKTHVSHLLAKTGARDRVHLVLIALRTGAVKLDDVLVHQS